MKLFMKFWIISYIRKLIIYFHQFLRLKKLRIFFPYFSIQKNLSTRFKKFFKLQENSLLQKSKGIKAKKIFSFSLKISFWYLNEFKVIYNFWKQKFDLPTAGNIHCFSIQTRSPQHLNKTFLQNSKLQSVVHKLLTNFTTALHFSKKTFSINKGPWKKYTTLWDPMIDAFNSTRYLRKLCVT